jgi:hypothetical protein
MNACNAFKAEQWALQFFKQLESTIQIGLKNHTLETLLFVPRLLMSFVRSASQGKELHPR